MFFLLRSAVCIGLVASALPDTTDHRRAEASASRSGASGAAITGALVHFCADNPAGCRRLLDTTLTSLSGSEPAPHAKGRLQTTRS